MWFYPLGKRRHIYLPQFGAESEKCCKKEKDKGLWGFRGRSCIKFYEERDIELSPKEKGNLGKCWRERGEGWRDTRESSLHRRKPHWDPFL